MEKLGMNAQENKMRRLPLAGLGLFLGLTGCVDKGYCSKYLNIADMDVWASKYGDGQRRVYIEDTTSATSLPIEGSDTMGSPGGEFETILTRAVPPHRFAQFTSPELETLYDVAMQHGDVTAGCTVSP